MALPISPSSASTFGFDPYHILLVIAIHLRNLGHLTTPQDGIPFLDFTRVIRINPPSGLIIGAVPSSMQVLSRRRSAIH